jgi:Zn-dependent M28 family amino/carboxypeptidase
MPSDIGAHLGSRRSLMAQERGAIGLINVRTLQTAKVYPWSRALENADEPLTTWVQDDGVPYRQSPKMRMGATVNGAAADALFAGAPRALADILAEADREGGRPKGFPLQPRVRFRSANEMQRFESPNVLGLLPGSDPKLAREVIVLVAHLDHIGITEGPSGPVVNNGALDNAAGVATMLEVARVMAQSPARPKRSVLFAAVTGEEMGLLGSHYLARHPAVKDAETVAVIALDAPILLYDFTDVIAFGEEHSSIGPVIARAVERAGIKSSPDPMPEQGIFTRSDHYSFVKEGVPGVFLVTGFANGGQKPFGDYLRTLYHRPADNMSLPIQWDAAAKFARVNYLIARDLADEPRRPLWYEGSLFAKTYAPGAPKAPRPGR